MDMSEAQKAIIHALWEADKTQNEIAVQVECSQSAISKITGRPCSKYFNCGSKSKTTDTCLPNRILISNRFDNSSGISKALNSIYIYINIYIYADRP